MIRLINAELLKVRTTRSFLGLTIGACALGALQIIAIILASAAGGGGGGGGLTTPSGFASYGSVAYIFAGVLGVLVITGEARHGTVDHTFLITPNRTQVVVAKAAAALMAGFVMGILVEIFIFALGLPLLAFRGVRYSFEAGIAIDVFWQSVAVGIMAVIGLTIGGLLRNQIGAIVVVAGWLFIGETLILGLLISRAGPYGIAATFRTVVNPQGGALRVWALALLVAYVLVLGGLGTAFLERRDVT